MADTRADITVPMRTWYNLYTATGITVGTAVKIQNKSSNIVYLVEKATAPSTVPSGNVPNTGYMMGVFDSMTSFAQVDAGASGLWAWSSSGGPILVQD